MISLVIPSRPRRRESKIERRGDPAGRAPPLHQHLEPPVAAQLEIVHHVRYQEEAAAPGRHQVGHGVGVEGLDVEPPAAVLNR